jgi:DNA-binding NarL/FixJ family response regulator
MKDLSIAAILAMVMVLNAMDIVTDLDLGLPLAHIFTESLIVAASALGFIYLILQIRRQGRELRDLAENLTNADRQLQRLTDGMRTARASYGEVIHRQFLEWSLTDSEQQVAMLLLKGLSFREIATVRETREKTVRQQASAIYAKSGLEGRHAFSAWFLEDFMEAHPATAEANRQ